jgi:D-cysteine desulfhydrase
MDLIPPVRLTLAHVPTPLEPLTRLPALGGAEVWIKRDDLTGVALSGNKVRKLEFLAADALERGADTLITCGAVTSNHARATAVVAARLGLHSHLLLRGEDERPRRGNLLLDTLLGSSLEFITSEQWQARDALMATAAERLAAEGRRGYVIPEGGSNHLGAMGYAIGVAELLEQEQELGLRISRIVHAVGSGGTTAGIALGLAAAGREEVDVVGVAVCDDAAYFNDAVARIADSTVAAGYVPSPIRRRTRWRILEGFKGEGYGIASPDGIELIQEVARHEGVFLDPVYTGKAFAGMLAELGNSAPSGGATVFLHTGGIFGLFSFADQLSV